MNKKRLLSNSLLLLFSTALSLLVLEQSYRVYLFGSDSFSINKMNSIHNLGVSGLIKPSNHSEIIYELKPNLNTYFKLAIFKTNSDGLRDKDYNFSKSSNIFRVAVIGDSYAMPAGVEIEDSFHSLLEEKLNKEQRDSTYQFINFGVGGYNIRQYLGVIKFKAQEYDPDLIMVSFCPSNDHKIPSNEIFRQQYKVKPETYPFFQFFVIEALKRPIKRLIFANNKNKRKINNTVTFSEEEKKYMSHIFSEMNSYSKQTHIPIIIIYLTHRYNERYADELKDLVVNNGLNFANASLPFKGENIDEYNIYPTDGHPNAKANIIFAEELYDYLNLNSGEKIIIYIEK